MKLFNWIGRGWVLAALVAGGACNAPAATLYLSPRGNDKWSGKLEKPDGRGSDGPLATLTGARDAVRKLKAGGANEPIKVVVEDGTYPLMEPVLFTPEDSGTKAAPISYEAAPGAQPIFSGGRAITGFQTVSDGLWVADVPDVKAGKWYFEQLYVNGHRAVRARTPNKFYNYTEGKVAEGINPVTGKEEDMGNRAFIARQADIEPLLKLTPAELHDVTLVAYHS